MTTPLKIGPVQGDKAVRIAIEHESMSDLEITHIKPGETWTSYLHAGARIVEISEVNIGDVIIGRTHLGKMAAPVVTITEGHVTPHVCVSANSRCDICFGPMPGHENG